MQTQPREVFKLALSTVRLNIFLAIRLSLFFSSWQQGRSFSFPAAFSPSIAKLRDRAAQLLRQMRQITRTWDSFFMINQIPADFVIEATGCTLMKTHVFQWDTCNQMNSVMIPPPRKKEAVRTLVVWSRGRPIFCPLFHHPLLVCPLHFPFLLSLFPSLLPFSPSVFPFILLLRTGLSSNVGLIFH